MSRTSLLDRMVQASFFCGSFTKNDVRVERVLGAVETVVRRRLTHYFDTRGGRPKPIPDERTAFVSRWLPGLKEKFERQLLCPKSAQEHLLMVSLDNIVSLPELLGRRGEPCNGAVHVEVGREAPFTRHLVSRFADLVVATDCFHAFLRLPPLARQAYFTRQRLAARHQEIDKLRARSKSLEEANRKLLMSEADQYVYDIDERPLTGVAPNGKTFSLSLFWINYWSEATAERLGFPDAARDKPLQGLYERLPGGWLIKLTPDPTDLDKPADHERLQWAYDRFASGR